ncbi:hypothetical protein T01_1616 [Trichinella spiralis]|uniref:Uncharacterized protein n=1 Tax=Trichinella spiralis TaxID=6334 RepID=A0A0V1BJV9_TRISP|nr:hypothetical protein T01_1616 [Trichinella spiralis]
MDNLSMQNSSCSAKYDTAEVAMFFPAEGGGGYMPLPLTDGRCFTGRPQHQIMHNLASLDTGGRSFKNFIRYLVEWKRSTTMDAIHNGQYSCTL